MKSIIFLLSTLAVTNADAQNSDFQVFHDAYAQRDFKRCVEVGERLTTYLPHPSLLYKLAACYCQIDSTDKSVLLLDKLARRGVPFDVAENSLLQKLANDTSFIRIAKRFQQNNKPVNNSTNAFELNDPQLIPEGITADATTGEFYIGSLAKNKIIKYKSKEKEKDFIKTGTQHVWSIVGLKLSADGREIWACSASEKKESAGYSGLFCFERKSGQLIKRYDLKEKNKAHFFNDLAIKKDKSIYLTDSKAGKVIHIQPGNDSIRSPFTHNFIYPNGIALNTAETHLFVADYTGIYKVDLKTGETKPLADKGITYLHGVDGLYYYQRSLIAIQGIDDDIRIVRFILDKNEQEVERTLVLQTPLPDYDIPTTGVIVKNEFYYISNSHLRHLQPDGTITEVEKLRKPLIKKIRLKL